MKKTITKKDVIEYANIIKEVRINESISPFNCWERLKIALLQYDNVYWCDDGNIKIRFKNGTHHYLYSIIPDDFYYSRVGKYLK